MNLDSDKKVNMIFPQRLDFYYQTIAIYAIVLLAYSVLKGTIEGGTLTVRIIDPISILLVIFIIGTTIAMLFDIAQKREIAIGDDFISFKSGKKEKVYSISEIERIAIKADRTFHFKSNYRTALIKLSSRKRPIRIRFSSYHDDANLSDAIFALKSRLDK